MDKINDKFMSVFIRTMCLGIFGYIIDSYLAESLDWVVWLLLVLVILPAGLMHERLIKRLVRRTYKDTLTGLDNRRYFYISLNNEIKKIKDRKHPVSFLMIDIDNFKKVNDTYGHLAGDMVLKQMAHIFRQSIRTNDNVIRWGGEEFAVILADTDVEGARRFAERIRSSVEDNEFNCEGIYCKITVSIGIASTNEAIGIDDFIRVADTALYKAKKKRNQVVCSEDTLAVERAC